MCGITGIWAFNEVGRFQMTNLVKSTQSLSHRGPDDQGTYNDHFVGLGHRRLSIIDTSAAGHQPMSAEDGRYQLVFNGEFYNYQEIRSELRSKGVRFNSESDTEVLLHLLIQEGIEGLKKVNGFFALAFYDRMMSRMLIARDRVGIKPLLYYQDEFKFLFASEMQAILAYGLEKSIDNQALYYYLQLNYTPAPLTMINGIKKLQPGHFVEIEDGSVKHGSYYELPGLDGSLQSTLNYEDAQGRLAQLLEKSVERRMIADVPLGCFLSGGIDSSVIAAVAAKKTDQLSTFSIGFSDNPFFDETHYAEAVAKKIGTTHTTFKLTNDEMLGHLGDIVDRIDEPFADTSAIPVYILSNKTRKHITVVLSGDGADEIFSGYNKHAAWLKLAGNSISNSLLKSAAPLAAIFPKSRSGRISNIMRQVVKYGKASRLKPSDRYWLLATLNSDEEVRNLIKYEERENELKKYWLSDFKTGHGINQMLRADTSLVLPNDMLKKVDLMSMANGLEVRVPFLDHELVDFAFSLPAEYKINHRMRKRILQDTFRNQLPDTLYNRPKKGFEMPVLDWLRTALNSELRLHLFNKEKILDQGIFQWEAVCRLDKKLHSRNPEDSHAHVWALYIFQKWYVRHFL